MKRRPREAKIKVPEINLATGRKREVGLPADLLLTPQPRLLHQAVVTEEKRRHIPRAHTKTRGEVRGGGRKPWRQKGTGRARHGSIRSPIWKGGGITHGPRAVRRKVRLPQAMKLRALAMALGGKCADGEIWLVPAFTLPQPKTKEALKQLQHLPAPPSRLLLLSSKNPTLSHWRRAVRNLPRVLLKTAGEVTALDLLQRTALIIEHSALKELTQRLTQAGEEKISSAGEKEGKREKVKRAGRKKKEAGQQ